MNINLLNLYKRGFTLIELLVVISLISILSMVLLGVLNVPGLRGKTGDAVRRANFNKIVMGIKGYETLMGMCPVCVSPGGDPSGTSGSTYACGDAAQQAEVQKYIKRWPNGSPTAADVYTYICDASGHWTITGSVTDGTPFVYDSITDTVAEVGGGVGPGVTSVPVPTSTPSINPTVTTKPVATATPKPVATATPTPRPTATPTATPTPLPEYWVIKSSLPVNCYDYCAYSGASCSNACHRIEDPNSTYKYGVGCLYTDSSRDYGDIAYCGPNTNTNFCDGIQPNKTTKVSYCCCEPNNW